jgi:hypothetical protein
MKQIEIVNVDINVLKPYENNPRFNEDAVNYVADSIKEFGFKVPIVIDKNNEIIAGHTRYKASQKLGLKEVPCIVADDLNEEQIKAFRIIDNKVGDFSLWDYEKLKEEIDGLDPDNFDIDLNNFNLDMYSVYDTLDETGLSKTERQEKDTFLITFSVKMEYKKLFDTYLKEHSKEDLNALFINVIKGMSENES